MTEYEVIITPAAEQDLKEIFSYIATELFEPETATKLCNRIQDEILGLDKMPERHAPYKKNRGFRAVCGLSLSGTSLFGMGINAGGVEGV